MKIVVKTGGIQPVIYVYYRKQEAHKLPVLMKIMVKAGALLPLICWRKDRIILLLRTCLGTCCYVRGFDMSHVT